MSSAAFDQAAADLKTLAKEPSNDEKLKLYGLFKIAKGEDFSSASKPGMFDMTGKAKYSAWEKQVKEGTTPEVAQQEYVALVDQLKEKYGTK